MPSQRSKVGRSTSERNKIARFNAISILNRAVKVITEEFKGASEKTTVYDVAFLNPEAKEKVIQLFHNTIMRTRDGGCLNSKEGLLECRRIFKDELNELRSSNNENDQLALQYATMLDLPSGPKGGRSLLFNVCPTYTKNITSRVNLFTDGVFSEGEYTTNVGYGVLLSYALLHMMTAVKNKAIIPQYVHRSLLVIVPSSIPFADECAAILSTSLLSYFDEDGYNCVQTGSSVHNPYAKESHEY